MAPCEQHLGECWVSSLCTSGLRKKNALAVPGSQVVAYVFRLISNCGRLSRPSHPRGSICEPHHFADAPAGRVYVAPEVCANRPIRSVTDTWSWSVFRSCLPQWQPPSHYYCLSLVANVV